MNFPFYIARRLSLGNGGKHLSPAVIVAIISIAISVIVMIASIAIVLGFKNEIRDKLVGFNGHISIFKVPTNENDDNLISINSFIKETLDSQPFVKDYNVTASIPAILKTSEDFKGVYLRGMTGENLRNYIDKNLEEGELPEYGKDDDKNKIIISRIAANKLRLNVGDKIDTYFITDDIRVRKLEIAGIYNSHFEQYDDLIIFGGMDLVAQIGNLPEGTGTYIVVETDDFDKIPQYTEEIQGLINMAVASGQTDTYYRTDNVMTQGRSLFSWLSLLDTNVIVIIILMLVVSCVTLISGMLIIILERKKFIGLMRALGANTNKIRNIFIFLSVKITLIGIIAGDALAVILLYLQQKYHFLHLDADAYYINFVPVYLPAWIVVAINIGVIIVSYLILVLPSRFVGKISPAESMVRAE